MDNQAHISFAATHGKEPGQEIVVDGVTYQLFVEHCLQDSKGACYPAQLEQHNFSKTIKKGSDEDDECFSAFASFGKHRDTGLTQYLRQNDVKKLYIAGVTLEQCVLHSVKHALQAEFETYLIEDACAPVDQNAERQTLQYLKSLGAKLVLSKQLSDSFPSC